MLGSNEAGTANVVCLMRSPGLTNSVLYSCSCLSKIPNIYFNGREDAS